MQYYFILGKNPQLSKAELEAVLELLEIKFKIKDFKDNILILDTAKTLDIELLNQRLGGTVKIGQIIDQVDSLEQVSNKFCQLIKCQQGKLHFGFSLYLLTDKVNLKKKLQKLKPVAMEIKRKMREEKNLNSRWVVSKEPQLSSVIVKKNQLLKYGSEICLFFSDKNILVGQTLAVQQFEEFGARDYARPGRDDVSGMLPPKLARIMLNLAKIKSDSTLLDPFCGSGTILQEAIILGYKDLVGFDSSTKAIKDTEANLEWLYEKYDLSVEDINIKQVNVRELDNHLDKESVDYIVTEPYLGPPLKGNESAEQINNNIAELEDLYTKAFEEFGKVLKYKGKVVIVIPEFKIKNQTKTLNLDNVKNFQVLNEERLVYSRPTQHVWRNIMIFEKTK